MAEHAPAMTAPNAIAIPVKSASRHFDYLWGIVPRYLGMLLIALPSNSACDPLSECR